MKSWLNTLILTLIHISPQICLNGEIFSLIQSNNDPFIAVSSLVP